VAQRATQTAGYWRQLTVEVSDVECLFQVFLESNEPQSTENLAIQLIQHRCQEEEMVLRSEIQGGTLYQPQGSYTVEEELVFPRFNYDAGPVVGQRASSNPRYGDFTVIQVEFGENGDVREFVADFAHPHSLNLGEGEVFADAEGTASPPELYRQYQDSIAPKLVNELETNPDFVNLGDLWLLKDLLAPIHDGHLNIAEAVIDINEGPLSADAILKDIELPADMPASTQEFSLNAALTLNARFDNVGPKGQVRWYLRSLEPADIEEIPLHVLVPELPFESVRFNDDLQPLLNEIDDEATDRALLSPPSTKAETVTIVLNYPHRRSGTLPITPKTAPFFPEADNHHVRITLLDQESGDRFPGWVTSQHNYVLGLSQWYDQNQLTTGAYVSLHRTDDPMTVVVSCRPVRPKREWIRGVVVQGSKIIFQNVRQVIACEYDDLMIVGEGSDQAALDGVWISNQENPKPLLALLQQIAMELVKINPQGTVHAKTLYSAVNVVRRCPPAPIFHQLSTHPCFVPMGHGYWTFDATRRD